MESVPALSIKAGEVAVLHGRGRDTVVVERARALLVAFVVEEPEGPVLAVVHLGDEHGAADGAAELVAVQFRGGVGEIVAGARQAVTIIAVGFEERAVNLVGAALGGHDDGGLPGVLGLGGVDLHVELLDAVQAGHARDRVAAVQLVGEGGAVDDDIMRAAAGAEYAHAAVDVDAGHGRHQVHDVAAVDGQLLNALALERVAQRRGVGGQNRGGVLNADHGLSAGGLQDDVQRGRLRRLDVQLRLKLTHAGRFGHHFVSAGSDGGEHIHAHRATRCFQFNAGRHIGDRHVGVGNYCLSLVRDGAADATVAGLRKGGRSQQCKDQENKNSSSKKSFRTCSYQKRASKLFG